MPDGKEEVFSTRLAYAKAHGKALSQEVQRMLGSEAKPISKVPTGAFERVDLPFDTLPTREEWEARVAEGGSASYHAGKHLERLQRGESIQTELSYPIQTWTFGDELAMVFLASEVVV